jgi:hypothetical protein
VSKLLTGTDREVYRAPGDVECVGAAQPTKLFCSLTTQETIQKTEIFSMSLESGALASLHTFSDSASVYHSVAYADDDDKVIYLWEFQNVDWKMLRLESNGDRLTVSESAEYSEGEPPVTVRQQWLIRRDRQSIEVRPRSGGDWRRLVYLDKHLNEASSMMPGFSPDGRWMYYGDLDSTGKPGLYRVNTGGGAPERLGNLPAAMGSNGSFRISPDGKRIVFTVDYRGRDFWSLDHFCPRSAQR